MLGNPVSTSCPDPLPTRDTFLDLSSSSLSLEPQPQEAQSPSIICLLSKLLLRNDVCVDIAFTCRNIIPLLPTQNPCLKIMVQFRVLSQFQLMIFHLFWNLNRHNLNLIISLSTFLLRNDICVDTASTCRNIIPLMPTRDSC